jgi:ankyrin repeat protein
MLQDLELPENLDKALPSGERIPQTLEELYDLKLSKLLPMQPAMEILTWVYFARESLSIKELREAIDVNLSGSGLSTDVKQWDRLIETECLRLISVDSNAGVVVPSQSSFQEYLAQNHERWLKHQFPEFKNPHALIAKKCLEYLHSTALTGTSPRSFSKLGDEPERYPLLQYAANNWGWHARQLRLEDYVKGAMDLFASDGKTMRAGLIIGLSETHKSSLEKAYVGMRPLHLCAIFGLTALAEHLVSTKMHDVDSTTEAGWSALHWAARNGSEEVVDFLLKSHARTDFGPEDERLTPLHLAAKEGHHGIVKLLLDAGARVDARDGQQRTPLYLACWYMQLEVVQTLLSHTRKADANIKTKLGVSPLHCAAKKGDVDIVRALIDSSNIHELNDLGFGAVDEAARTGHQHVVDVLLRAGAKAKKEKFTDGATFTPSDWSHYEIDKEKTSSMVQGAQCLSEVLQTTLSYKGRPTVSNMSISCSPCFVSLRC